jgi:hypothetical protein
MLTSKSYSFVSKFDLKNFLANPMMAPKPPITRGLDFDAQGVINGQSTYEYDITNAYKDEEKPWKKPGLFLV